MPGHPALSRTDHRPWPIPARPWTWRQTWHDLLFLHWPVPAAALRPLVPERLVIEEFDGSAWVAVTPFRMSGVTLRWIPPLPLLSRFPELNVRTYVSYGGTPGVWFFSLDAGNPVAVRVARRWFHLPYVYARMRVRGAGDRVEYRSVRPSGAGFEATYQPIAPAEVRRPGTLEHWLTERYCLYAVSWTGDLHRAEIQHEPWPLQEATVTIHRNDMLHLHGIAAGQVPHVLFARRLDVVVWSLQPVTDRREDRP